jgi:very-short-patch-repair endonuclease
MSGFNYQERKQLRAKYARLAVEGKDAWFRGDPYAIWDWGIAFTPIEAAVWTDIRGRGLDLWPQLPVGRYFVDFGNPVARVAIECDGKDFHDERRDALRDAELARSGWRVWRVPGWACLKESRDCNELRQSLEEVGVALDYVAARLMARNYGD